MLAPLRRCVDGWPCMVDDLRGRRMRTGSKIENPSTVLPRESRELPFLLFNFLSNLNRAAYKWFHRKVGHVPRASPLGSDSLFAVERSRVWSDERDLLWS